MYGYPAVSTSGPVRSTHDVEFPMNKKAGKFV